MLRLIGLLLLIPLVEVVLLVLLTGVIGWQLVVLLVVLTALVGLLLVRAEGRHTLAKIQRKAARGEPPTDELIDGGLLIAAGAFLLTPGLLTDTLGFLFVVPLTRYPIRVALKKWVITPYVDDKTGGFASGNVYIGGFPGSGGPGQQPGGQQSADGDDGGFGNARDVEFDEVDES
jgi:UPF0716 protein FxsA